MNGDVTPGWNLVSIDVEGAEVTLEGIDLWKHEGEWRRTGEDPITVAHPSSPAQRHQMFVYELAFPSKRIRFAAGEFSNGVFGFYSPK